MISKNSEKLIYLIDVAISEAQKVQKEAIEQNAEWLIEDSQMAIDNFLDMKKEVISNKLQPSDGAGLGISRALSEWAPDNLYKAGKELEDFYKDNW